MDGVMKGSRSGAPAGRGVCADAEITAELARLSALHGGPPPREEVVLLFRRRLSAVRGEIRTEFEAGTSGLVAARRLAGHLDGLVAALHHHATEQVFPAGVRSAAEHVALVATGGYGRGVLAPFSDVDLLFLTPWRETPRHEQVVEYMLYLLWDLGLAVGHATRSVEECLRQARADLTVRTSLLDARFLAGDTEVAEEFATRFRDDCIAAGAAGFIAGKRAERTARHQKFGDSAYLVEPNIKDGTGGLRDLQTLYWEARYVLGVSGLAGEPGNGTGTANGGASLITEAEEKAYARALDYLWSVRFHLHYATGRAEERLTFDLQPVIGARMGYTRHGSTAGVERFMKHYFLTAREVRRLTMVLEPMLDRLARGAPALAPETTPALAAAGFALEDARLVLAPGRSFADEPILMFRCLVAARTTGRELHPMTLLALMREARRVVGLRDDAEANGLFLDLLAGPFGAAAGHRADGADWLRVMNETGLLGRFIPDWGRIIGQMQFDTYHLFTVDEHTIEAIAVLNRLERGELDAIAPVSASLIGQLQSRRALYAAMLLHDIAKGRGGDHSELGAEIASQLGPRLGLSAEETETASWLVLNHLVLSQTAFKRDIEDAKTIIDLADLVQSPERLRLLLVLTVADMRAVNPRVWNNWKATLLRELYWRVAEVLAGGLSVGERDVRVERARQALAAQLDGWPQADIDAFLALGYGPYWLAFDPATHARHAALTREAAATGQGLLVDTRPMPARGVTEVTVYTQDHPGLFSRIAGSLAVAGASIVDARIHTMTNGMALDTFWVQDVSGGAFESPHRLARLSVLIDQALSGRLKLADEIRKLRPISPRLRGVLIPPRVVIDNHASASHTVVEVNARDRPGLLHDVTAAMSAQELQIASAHVTTFGLRAVDVFYVKDAFGLKIENERKLATLREALEAALAEPGSADAPPPPPA
ncbi:MAG: [protein-PII] uridylyltransferase [Acetobacteraceae bacterium]|nr:[protein-PII] uridylyltransferase [Acetobacteraceae bacterium]